MKKLSPYGRKAGPDGEMQDLGTSLTRFESAPPDGVMLPADAWEALAAVDLALTHAEVRHYGGHRHYG